MNCTDFRDLLNPFLDSELEVDQNVACLKHIELCTTCATRVQDERQLHDRILQATQEPLGTEARADLLAGVFARAEAEAVAPPPAPSWRRYLVALAASLLLALGGGWFVTTDPLCWWGCTTMDLLLQAQGYMDEEPLPLAEVEQQIHHTVDYPELVGSEVVGCQALVSEGCPCHPLVRYSLPGTEDICYVSLPGGCAHVGETRRLPDGREYVVGEHDTLRFVGWRRPDGSLAVCMPTSKDLPNEKLYVLAAALRGR